MANNTKFWIKSSVLSLIGTYLTTAFIVGELDSSCWHARVKVAMLWSTLFILWLIGLLKTD